MAKPSSASHQVGFNERFVLPHALDRRRLENLVSVSRVNTKASVWREEEGREREKEERGGGRGRKGGRDERWNEEGREEGRKGGRKGGMREEGRKDQKIMHKAVNHSSPKALPP